MLERDLKRVQRRAVDPGLAARAGLSLCKQVRLFRSARVMIIPCLLLSLGIEAEVDSNTSG